MHPRAQFGFKPEQIKALQTEEAVALRKIKSGGILTIISALPAAGSAAYLGRNLLMNQSKQPKELILSSSKLPDVVAPDAKPIEQVATK